jgi:bifunctional UDP-N-acetylglucosamine pyrophosphorylase/glucosamine-1-phosphate N-acetyltransferase
MGLNVVVLAAGEGKRFRSSLPKPLHPLAGRPLLWHVLAAAAELKADRTVVVIGRGADEVRTAVSSFGLGPVEFAVQHEPRGTGDAAACALPLLPGQGEVLVLYGDTPLVTPGTLRRLLDAHRAGGAAATMLTCEAADPAGYGRVLRGPDGTVVGVVEERDATGAQRAVTEINAGLYVLDRSLLDALATLRADNDQGELYLPDLLPIALKEGGRVLTVSAPMEEVQGVNDRAQLAGVGAVLRRRMLERLLEAGVTMVDPATVYVDADVEVGRDTVLEPLVFLEAGTRVGERCQIGPNARLVACTVADEATVTQAVGVQATIGPGAIVGPFAYLRPGADLGPRSKVGTYVEVKKSHIGAGSKVPHLTYVGDAEIGEGVNVGAGTVFVNYDGVAKHRTVVGDGAFIGSDTMLVAPLTVGDGAQTGAGSTITKDVPPGALAIERSDQRIIEGWVDRRRRRGQAESGQAESGKTERDHSGDHEQSD